MDLEDAILLLRDPRLGKRGMILAAKLAARELGPVVFAALVLLVASYWIATALLYLAERGRNPEFDTLPKSKCSAA